MDNFKPNAAWRLYKFISEFKMAAQNGGDVEHILGAMSGIDSPSTSDLTKMIGEVWQLPEQLRTELETIQGLDTSAFIQVLEQFEIAMTYLALDNAPNGFLSGITGLEASFMMMSAMISRDKPEKVLSDNDRQKLVSQLETILKDVKDSSLEEEFKNFVHQRVSSIIYALQRYEVLGSTKIIEEVEKMFGSLVRSLPEISNSQKKVSLAKKLYAAGAAVLLALNLVNGGLQLDAQLLHLISSESPIQQPNPKAATTEKEK